MNVQYTLYMYRYFFSFFTFFFTKLLLHFENIYIFKTWQIFVKPFPSDINLNEPQLCRQKLQKWIKEGKKPRSTQSLVLTHLYIDLLESNTSNFERLVARTPRCSTIKAQNVKEKIKVLWKSLNLTRNHQYLKNTHYIIILLW